MSNAQRRRYYAIRARKNSLAKNTLYKPYKALKPKPFDVKWR